MTDLREDFEEKRRQNQELEEERNELTRQLQMAIARSDTESLAKSIAHETIADLEKEKTMKELEIKDLIARHKTELSNKDILITSVISILTLTFSSNLDLILVGHCSSFALYGYFKTIVPRQGVRVQEIR